jgi:hypothetical protein
MAASMAADQSTPQLSRTNFSKPPRGEKIAPGATATFASSESDQRDLFYAGGGKSGRVRAVRKPRRRSGQ